MKERAATFKLPMLSSSPPVPECFTQEIICVSPRASPLNSCFCDPYHRLLSIVTFHVRILCILYVCWFCFDFFFFFNSGYLTYIDLWSLPITQEENQFPAYSTAPPAPGSSQLITPFSHAPETIPNSYPVHFNISTKSSHTL